MSASRFTVEETWSKRFKGHAMAAIAAKGGPGGTQVRLCVGTTVTEFNNPGAVREALDLLKEAAEAAWPGFEP